MAERDTSAIALSSKQTETSVEDLSNHGATFFTYEQLQKWIEKLGPDTKVSALQELQRRLNTKTPKQ